MPVKLAALTEFAYGVTWEVDEPAHRTSHAVLAGGRVWLIDPVDEAEALKRAAGLGEPAAVIQLIDRHNRDCGAIASRLGVPYLKIPDAVPDSPFEAVPVLRIPGWRETALWWPEREMLLVGEALGTAAVFTTGHGAVGMHPLLRPLPPGSLRAYAPEHLLVGHGPPVHGQAARDGVAWAYAHARTDLVRLPLALARIARG